MWLRAIFGLPMVSLIGCMHLSATDRIEYVVADQTIAFDRRPWEAKGNLRPWEEGETINPDGTMTIVVSNSCGFVDMTLRVQSLGSFLRGPSTPKHHMKIIASMGEWCRVRHLIVDSDELLYLRNWRGQYFLEGAAPILRDSEKRPFIVNSELIEYAELGHMTVPLNADSNSGGCFARSELTPDFIEELRAEAELVEVAYGMCFSRGVYLDRLQSALADRRER